MIVRYCRKHLKDLHCLQKSSRWSVSRRAQIDAFPCIVWECISACFLHSRYASFVFYFLLDQQPPPTVSIFFSLCSRLSLSSLCLSHSICVCTDGRVWGPDCCFTQSVNIDCSSLTVCQYSPIYKHIKNRPQIKGNFCCSARNTFEQRKKQKKAKCLEQNYSLVFVFFIN